jgi:transposase
LLLCSGVWADKLTADARKALKPQRDAAKAQRDPEIIRLKGEGKTHREVAKVVDASIGTISAVQKQYSIGAEQEAPAVQDDEPPLLSEAAKANLRIVLSRAGTA